MHTCAARVSAGAFFQSQYFAMVICSQDVQFLLGCTHTWLLCLSFPNFLGIIDVTLQLQLPEVCLLRNLDILCCSVVVLLIQFRLTRQFKLMIFSFLIVLQAVWLMFPRLHMHVYAFCSKVKFVLMPMLLSLDSLGCCSRCLVRI